MTDIDVPDWVVEVANDVLADHARDGDGVAHEALKAALRAALSAWVEVAGYVHPDTIKGLRAGLSSKSFLFAQPLPQMWADIPLYTMRQEKPE